MVNQLDKLKKLKNEIQSSLLVKRYQELEKIIDNDQNLKDQYNKLLDYQKEMVNKKALNKKGLEESTKKYETQKELVMNYLIIDEYLELQQQINADLQMIQSIISDEIDKDINEKS